MTRIRSRLVQTLIISAVIAVSWTSTASAECLRRVYNRSASVLVGSQNGGPAFVVRPGQAASMRLSGPGYIDLTAYCSPFDLISQSVGGGREAVHINLAYEAVLDRCFMKIGDSFFERDLGAGFFGTRDNAPFTVNNPDQGDIVLGPFKAECSAAY